MAGSRRAAAEDTASQRSSVSCLYEDGVRKRSRQIAVRVNALCDEAWWRGRWHVVAVQNYKLYKRSS